MEEEIQQAKLANSTSTKHNINSHRVSKLENQKMCSTELTKLKPKLKKQMTKDNVTANAKSAMVIHNVTNIMANEIE